MYLRIAIEQSEVTHWQERIAYPYSSPSQILDSALPKGFHSCQEYSDNIVNKKFRIISVHSPVVLDVRFNNFILI